MEHRRKLVHVTRIPIRWGDMDAYGHVNNTVYFRFMEQARVEWSEGMNVPVRPGGAGPVIVNASCTFLIPMNYPGTVEVRTYAGHAGPLQCPDPCRNATSSATSASMPKARPRWCGWIRRPENRCHCPIMCGR